MLYYASTSIAIKYTLEPPFSKSEIRHCTVVTYCNFCEALQNNLINVLTLIVYSVYSFPACASQLSPIFIELFPMQLKGSLSHSLRIMWYTCSLIIHVKQPCSSVSSTNSGMEPGQSSGGMFALETTRPLFYLLWMQGGSYHSSMTTQPSWRCISQLNQTMELKCGVWPVTLTALRR